MTQDQLVGETNARFRQHFGQPPKWTVCAPGRVNIIGEHTDYNDGFVLPMAIERWTVIAARPVPGTRATLHSQGLDSTAEVELSQSITPTQPVWANYIRGVISGFQRLGRSISGFEAWVDSTVPLGSGLSSSAALEVASATLLEAVTEQALDPVDKALLCQKAEHEFAGVPCGIMDQFTSALAKADHLLLLDCRSRKVKYVPMTDPNVTVLIVNTNIRHELAGGEYARRRAECEAAAKVLGVAALRDATMAGLLGAKNRLDPVHFRRARHVINEIQRTLDAAEAIAASDWPLVGDLMYASHASLRDDYEVSCRELDVVVEIAESIGRSGGVYGCRMTGGGFGGCAVSLIQTSRTDEVARQVAQAYQGQTGIEPALFISRPADGARAVSTG